MARHLGLSKFKLSVHLDMLQYCCNIEKYHWQYEDNLEMQQINQYNINVYIESLLLQTCL